jgi:transcriptional regulator with XRE-family HTH domain
VSGDRLADVVLATLTSPLPDLDTARRTRPPRVYTSMVGAAMTAALITAPSTGARLPFERTVPPLTQQAITPASSAPSATQRPEPSTAAIVQELRQKSGLTWDQLGRLVGVSRRAVHLWVAGGRVNAHHLELLTQLHQIVDRLPATSPVERRALLFQTRRGEPSIFDAFLRQRTSEAGVVAGTPFAPDELFGARHDDGRGD